MNTCPASYLEMGPKCKWQIHGSTLFFRADLLRSSRKRKYLETGFRIESSSGLTSTVQRLDAELFWDIPLDSPSGRGFICPDIILLYNVLMLKGSTVKGRLPVSMAYILTPLQHCIREGSLLTGVHQTVACTCTCSACAVAHCSSSFVNHFC